MVSQTPQSGADLWLLSQCILSFYLTKPPFRLVVFAVCLLGLQSLCGFLNPTVWSSLEQTCGCSPNAAYNFPSKSSFEFVVLQSVVSLVKHPQCQLRFTFTVCKREVSNIHRRSLDRDFYSETSPMDLKFTGSVGKILLGHCLATHSQSQ